MFDKCYGKSREKEQQKKMWPPLMWIYQDGCYSWVKRFLPASYPLARGVLALRLFPPLLHFDLYKWTLLKPTGERAFLGT